MDYIERVEEATSGWILLITHPELEHYLPNNLEWEMDDEGKINIHIDDLILVVEAVRDAVRDGARDPWLAVLLPKLELALDTIQ